MKTEIIHKPLQETRLFLPWWWIRAFEVLASASSLGRGSLEQIAESRIMPFLDCDELSMLCLFLSKIQSQLLASGGKTFFIHDGDISGDNPFTRQSKLFVAEKALSQIPCIKLLSRTGDKSWNMSSGQRIGKKNDMRWLEVDLSVPGEEFVLGFCHAHRDLISGIRNEDLCTDVFEGYSPLCIWKSLWLDLDLNGQLLVLRIEKAMQLNHSWLQLDGTAGLSWTEAFAGVHFQARKSQTSQFFRQKKLLEVLGKKLEDHGIFSSHVNKNYLAFSKDPGPTLAFRSSDGLKASQDLATYAASVGQYFAKRRLGLQLIQMTSPDSLAAWTGFYESLTDEDKFLSLELNGRIFVAFDLFAEWMLRLSDKLPFKVHDSLTGLRLSVAEAWIVFKEKWNSFDFKSELKSLNLSLASEESLSDTQILKQLSTNKSREKQPFEPSLPKTESVQRPKTPLAPRDQVARAAASEELERLKKQNLESYKNLCEAYLSSLKEEERQLFEAIKKQMTPVIFETQLRARLIRFMIENPTSWDATKSASKSKK